jgi:hypothetical protein
LKQSYGMSGKYYLLKFAPDGPVLNIQACILEIGFSGKVKKPVRAGISRDLHGDIVFWQGRDLSAKMQIEGRQRHEVHFK